MGRGSLFVSENDSLPLRNYHLIRELYVLFDAYDRDILGSFDLIASQYRMLRILAETPGQRLTVLSERMLLSKSTISRLVDQMEVRGWVKRVVDQQDRRAQSVTLTAIGFENLSIISEIYLQSLMERLKCISQQEFEHLEVLLQRISSGMSSIPRGCDDLLSNPGSLSPGALPKEVPPQPS